MSFIQSTNIAEWLRHSGHGNCQNEWNPKHEEPPKDTFMKTRKSPGLQIICFLHWPEAGAWVPSVGVSISIPGDLLQRTNIQDRDPNKLPFSASMCSSVYQNDLSCARKTLTGMLWGVTFFFSKNKKRERDEEDQIGKVTRIKKATTQNNSQESQC